MQANHNKIVPSIGYGFVEMLTFFPVLFFLAIYFSTETYLWIISWFLFFCITTIVQIVVKNRNITIVISLLCSVTGMMLLHHSVISSIIFLLICIVIGFRALLYSDRDIRDVFPYRLYWTVGVPVYFVGYIAYTFLDKLEAYRPIISSVGMLFLIIVLFLTNKNQLQKASLEKENHSTNRDMKRMNRVFLILTIVITVVLTNFQIIQSLLFNSMRSVLQFIISLLSGQERETQEPQQNDEMSQPILPAGEVKEPSAFAEFLEQLTMYFGIFLIIVVGMLAIALLFKKVRRFLLKIVRQLLQALKQMFTRSNKTETNTMYTDEKENMFDFKKWREEKQEQLKNKVSTLFNRKPNFEKFTPEEKTRYLYREIVRNRRKASEWKASMTAHEVLSISNEEWNELENIYDDVRYGEKKLDKKNEKELVQLWENIQNDNK
ncbi:hypothetical protein ACFOZ1_04405 [Gracilibacillus marinus]|uniref:DUF4129 domain-containing protein n=1 Tax=Gracilibacillus marinus TaxID=630535 RepID=A0ABV8VTJ2_9BACI